MYVFHLKLNLNDKCVLPCFIPFLAAILGTNSRPHLNNKHYIPLPLHMVNILTIVVVFNVTAQILLTNIRGNSRSSTPNIGQQFSSNKLISWSVRCLRGISMYVYIFSD